MNAKNFQDNLVDALTRILFIIEDKWLEKRDEGRRFAKEAVTGQCQDALDFLEDYQGVISDVTIQKGNIEFRGRNGLDRDRMWRISLKVEQVIPEEERRVAGAV